MSQIEAELWALTTPEGAALLAEVARLGSPGVGDLERWRRSESPDRVSAVARLAEARRKGAVKFTLADKMWLDPTGLEQATSETVARHKAARFADHGGPAVDYCCGIGGDAVALARHGPVIAVDRDHAMARRTAWNAQVHGVADRLLAVRADADRFLPPLGAWSHVDPDRRSGRPREKRSNRLDGYRPGVPTLHHIIRRSSAGAIKLGPASDFDEAFGGPDFEVEIVSLGGECKEATVWFGDARTCLRRATRLPEGASWTDRDGPRGHAAIQSPLGWAYEPDPSLTRSGLLDAFTVAHGLGRLSADSNVLTGRERLTSPFLTPFEVVASLPADLKTVKRELIARNIGRLEIKTAGFPVRPEAVRGRLRLLGDAAATLFLIGGKPSLALIARRYQGGERDSS